METKPKSTGRPTLSGKFLTKAKTYCFFSDDIDFMINSGATPKEIFRLGCISKRENPQLICRLRELEQGNTKLSKKLTEVYSELSLKMDKEKKKHL